jgi:hypothetical protein
MTAPDPVVEDLKRAFHEAFGPGARRDRVAIDVTRERERQNAKWGDLHYPDGTGRPGAAEFAAGFKAICKANDPDEDNWQDILTEEVFEALAETDPAMLRAELIQIAAVAQAWAEDIDSRAEKETAQ